MQGCFTPQPYGFVLLSSPERTDERQAGGRQGRQIFSDDIKTNADIYCLWVSDEYDYRDSVSLNMIIMDH